MYDANNERICEAPPPPFICVYLQLFIFVCTYVSCILMSCVQSEKGMNWDELYCISIFVYTESSPSTR
jgi:hypothetical protein